MCYYLAMKPYRWNQEKNDWLREFRGVTFDEVVEAIKNDGLIAVVNHANAARYPGQRILIVRVRDYVYGVPYVESGEAIFLKTVFPSRKLTRHYLKGREE